MTNETMQRRNIDPTALSEIGARLKLSRLALGRTQAEMASYMGSTTPGQAWENYEAGRRRISLDHALALRTIGLSIDWIYEGNDGRLRRDVYEAIKKYRGNGHQPLTSFKGRVAGR